MRILLLLCLALTACGGGDANQPSWVGTWATSMADVGTTFENQTVRQVARVSVGGDRVRVTFSHAFGTEPARIQMASIGLRSTGATIATGTLQPLTFEGSRVVQLEPGADVVSDPVELTVPSQSDIVVSVFVEGNAGQTTVHTNAHQTTYVTNGNLVDALDMPDDQTTTSWYWLCGIDVEVSSPPRVVVAFGDSITEGSGSSTDGNARYPDVLARELASAGNDTAVLNAGIGGNRVLTDGLPTLGFGPSGVSRFDRDVLSLTGATHVVVLEGANDLGIGNLTGPVVSTAQLITAYQTMIEEAHARSLVILFGTILPFRDAAFGEYWTVENERKRGTLNEWIRTSNEHDGFIDFDAAMRNPDDPERLLPAFDTGDHLHPSDEGYQRMGEVAAEVLLAEQ